MTRLTAADTEVLVVHDNPKHYRWYKQLTEASFRVKSEQAKRFGGGVALVYLTYIVDNYDSLPEHVIFLHGKEYCIHHPDSLVRLVNMQLSQDIVFKELGFRRSPSFMACHPLYVDKLKSLWTNIIEGHVSGALSTRFNELVNDRERLYGGKAHSKMVINRRAIQLHPLELYVSLLNWCKHSIDPATDLLEPLWEVLWNTP